jgi:heat shock protein HslJ
MVNGPASFFRSNIDAGGKVLGSGDCNSWSGGVVEDGWLGTGISTKLLGK